VGEEIQERLMTGRIVTREEAGRTFYHTVVTVADAGTPVRAPAAGAVLSLTLQAPHGNAGEVFIGSADTVGITGDATIGFSLKPGVDYGPLQLERPAQIWVNADNDGDQLVIVGVQ